MERLKENFPKGSYQDVPGLCKVATVQEIEEQGWSLSPGRYVGVVEEDQEEFDFKDRLEELNEKLDVLRNEAEELGTSISENAGSAYRTSRLLWRFSATSSSPFFTS